MIIALPALHAAPIQNVNASRVAATGKDSPRKVDWMISSFRSGNRDTSDRELTPPFEKKSMSLPTVSGTSMDTELETSSYTIISPTVSRPICIKYRRTSPIAIPNCLPSGFASSTSFPTLLDPVSGALSAKAKVVDIRSIMDRGGIGVEERAAVGCDCSALIAARDVDVEEEEELKRVKKR